MGLYHGNGGGEDRSQERDQVNEACEVKVGGFTE